LQNSHLRTPVQRVPLKHHAAQATALNSSAVRQSVIKEKTSGREHKKPESFHGCEEPRVDAKAESNVDERT
jgi:hypothetical protein